MKRIRSNAKTILVLDCTGSSNLLAARYNRSTGELQVDFSNGATYAYAGVTTGDWAGFRVADSKGGFLAKVIKPSYAATKLEGGTP